MKAYYADPANYERQKARHRASSKQNAEVRNETRRLWRARWKQFRTRWAAYRRKRYADPAERERRNALWNELRRTKSWKKKTSKKTQIRLLLEHLKENPPYPGSRDS